MGVNLTMLFRPTSGFSSAVSEPIIARDTVNASRTPKGACQMANTLELDIGSSVTTFLVEIPIGAYVIHLELTFSNL